MPEPDFLRNHSRPNSDELVWEEEYEAGYGARYDDSSEFLTATHAWRAGWRDADREIAQGLDSAKDRVGDETASVADWSLLGSGRDARVCGLPFDTRRNHTWKQSWIRADLELGVHVDNFLELAPNRPQQ